VLPPARGWTLRRLSAELRRDPPDVFFTMGIQVPLRCPCPTVVTVLDLAYLTFPSYFTWKWRRLGPWRARFAVRTADHLWAISEATKRDLTHLLGVPERRITVAHLGCGPEFHPCDDAETIRRVRQAHGLPERYVLYVGLLQPRKNIERLIAAFERIRAHHPALPHKLVIAGRKGWLYDDIFAAVERSPARDAIQFLGYVPKEDLPVVISEADVLVLVSLSEGFGLPVIEAMACGTAVITSNCSSLPEVAGDAALTVDPYSVEAIADALEQVAFDDALRADLEAKGMVRAREFTWDKTAHAVLGMLRNACGGTGA
jgi:glycosyltransferase involved in cell wall biosynthesis